MKHTLLAIDNVSLPLRNGVCLHLTKPDVRREPVLSPEAIGSAAPDNLAAHFYGTVIHDRGTYRMWYYACHRGLNPDWPPRKRQQIAKHPSWLIGEKEGNETFQGPLCYAESDDGIVWNKPSLRQVSFKGSRENNAIDLPHTLVSGASVIRDDEEPDPGRRYKMVYQFFPDQTEPTISEYGTLPTIACAVSPDGIAWRVTAMPFVGQFVEHCSFIRHGGQYIVHSQIFPGHTWSGAYTEGGAGGGRTGVAHATFDFDRWPDLWQWAFALPEPADPARRDSNGAYDQVHLGIGAASFGNVCVGLYGVWHSASFGEEFERISGDLGLVVSNDGVRFREPASTPGQPFIRREDSPATPLSGREFNTILCQGNGILTVGDATRIYHGRWRNTGQKAEDIAGHHGGEIALATICRDRWGALALNPDTADGAFCSLPMIVPKSAEIRLNAEGVTGLSVDLLDERLAAVPGFTGGRVVDTGGIDHPVRWDGRSAAHLAGRTVRVQVRLKRGGPAVDGVGPRVYAVYLGKPE